MNVGPQTGELTVDPIVVRIAVGDHDPMRTKMTFIVASLLASVVSIGVIFHDTSALPPNSPSAGIVKMVPATGVFNTSIDLQPPAGASCQGDSASGKYRWQGFIASASIDPGTLTYGGGAGPVAPAGTAFPLVSTTGTPIVDETTGVATTPGGPGLITPLVNVDFVGFPPGTLAGGTYNIGYACTLNNATTRYWTAPIRITNPGNVLNYAYGAAPAKPVLASPLTPGVGTLSGTFTQPTSVPAITGYTVTAVPTAGTTVNLALAAGATSFTLSGLVNGTLYSVSLIATNSIGSSPVSNTVVGAPAAAPPPPPPPPPAVQPNYVSLSPSRLADTRPGAETVDGLYAGEGIRAGGSTLQLTVTGRGSVALTATAVALNVTVVDPEGAGFVTVYPCGAAQPTASNLNYVPGVGVVVPNAVMAKVGTAGQVCVFVSASTHVIVDVNGFFPPTTSLQSINPARVLETRVGPGLITVDGLQQGDGQRAAGSVTSVQIGGRATVPTDASAVVLNVTVTGTQGDGFVTVYPCGTAIPTASNINYVTGATVANLVVAKIGASSSVCIFTNSAIDLIADVNGYFPATTTYKPLDPARLLETRSGLSTIDGLFNGIGLRSVNEITELTVTGRGGVPLGAATVVLNVTVAGSTASGFVTVYPCGIPAPLASNLNYGINTVVANAVTVKVGTDGKVCLRNSGPTELVVDVNGFLPT